MTINYGLSYYHSLILDRSQRFQHNHWLLIHVHYRNVCLLAFTDFMETIFKDLSSFSNRNGYENFVII